MNLRSFTAHMLLYFDKLRLGGCRKYSLLIGAVRSKQKEIDFLSNCICIESPDVFTAMPCLNQMSSDSHLVDLNLDHIIVSVGNDTRYP